MKVIQIWCSVAVAAARAQLEFPYSPELGVGSAIGRDGKTDYASPFQPPNMSYEQLIPINEQTIHTTTQVIDYKSYAQAVKAASPFSYEGWDTAAQTAFAVQSQREAGPNSAAVIKSMRADKQLRDWSYALQSLRPEASRLLEEQGPVAFANSYGEYFVAGEKNGGYASFEFSYEVIKPSMKRLIADVLENDYVWTPGSVSMRQSQSKLDSAGVKVASVQKGTNLYSVKKPSLEEAQRLQQEFSENFDATYGLNGTPLAFILSPYSERTDYQNALNSFIASKKDNAKLLQPKKVENPKVADMFFLCQVGLQFLGQDLTKADVTSKQRQKLNSMLGASLKKLREVASKSFTRESAFKACSDQGRINRTFLKMVASKSAVAATSDEIDGTPSCQGLPGQMAQASDAQIFEGLGKTIREVIVREGYRTKIQRQMSFHVKNDPWKLGNVFTFPPMPENFDKNKFRSFQPWHKSHNKLEWRQGEFDIAGRRDGRVITVRRDNSSTYPYVIFGQYKDDKDNGMMIKFKYDSESILQNNKEGNQDGWQKKQDSSGSYFAKYCYKNESSVDNDQCTW